jgi:multidrug efflux pump
MRVALGVAVFSGMLGVTFFGVFFTPVFYVVIRKLAGAESVKTATTSLPPATHDGKPTPAAPVHEVS